jgi:hypothetical protein
MWFVDNESCSSGPMIREKPGGYVDYERRKTNYHFICDMYEVQWEGSCKMAREHAALDDLISEHEHSVPVKGRAVGAEIRRMQQAIC